MNHKGVEYTVVRSEPGFWDWRFRIGEQVKTGVGPVDITIQLETTDETPLAAKALFVTLANEKSGIAPQAVEAERTGDDQWLVKMSAPLAGRWMLGLGITFPNFDRLDVESPIIIK
jgi:hypothetical protein